MRITAHQPNWLPGASVIEKVRSSDAVIWLDTVQWTKGGWTNRNKTPDGLWLTVPVAHGSAFSPINRVRIGNPRGDWRLFVEERIRTVWSGELVDRVCREIRRGYPLLVGLNAAVLGHLLDGWAGEQHWQSHLDDAHAVAAVSDEPMALAPISERLAQMVAALDGTTYVSGPSGRAYLDESPFRARGITVDYYEHTGPNPCALGLAERMAA